MGMNLMIAVVAGIAAAWLAGRIMRGNGFGLPGDAIVGVIGALIGGYVFHTVAREFGDGMIGNVVVAFAAALLLLFVVRLFTGRRSGRRLWS
jgi:uncharacterized membrane protein YeaQ/YmgE (transglycosylase-associated protein family)